MKLHGNRSASNCRRVTMYLAEKALPLEVVEVDTAAGQHRTPQFLARNPAGLIPVLELDDGSYLPESSAIVEYLEDKYPQLPLRGITAEQKGRVRALERIASDLAILCAIKLRHTHPLFAQRLKQLPDAAEAVGPMLDAQLHTLEQHLGDSLYLAGPSLTTADITLFTTFQFCRVKLEVPIGAEYPRLDVWYERVAARPSAAYPS